MAIRDDKPASANDGPSMVIWLRERLEVKTDARVCQKWLHTNWSKEGVLLTPEAVEAEIGDRLRLAQYAHKFSDVTAAETLEADLALGDTPVTVCADVLRQWYDKYHPSSRPWEFATSAALEAAMGDYMREKYSGLTGYALRTALASRLKTVLVSEWVARTWVSEYSATDAFSSGGPPVLKRPAAQSRVLKRPSTAKQPAKKRPRVEPAAAVEIITLNDAKSIEAACGERYRTNVICLISAILFSI